jgi:SAM-dependent methyltransferase
MLPPPDKPDSKEVFMMPMTQRIMAYTRGLVKRYGPSNIKQFLWDQEFIQDKWHFIDDTRGDVVYPYLAKYAKGGDILDLGCGPGNTASELEECAYSLYHGVDISEAALNKAVHRTIESNRTHKNTFLRGDFVHYEPSRQYDLILFRESLYHVPLRKISAMLHRYSGCLKAGGVFVVRIHIIREGRIRNRPQSAIRIVESEFAVLEKHQHGKSGPTVLVFQPR